VLYRNPAQMPPKKKATKSSTSEQRPRKSRRTENGSESVSAPEAQEPEEEVQDDNLVNDKPQPDEVIEQAPIETQVIRQDYGAPNQSIYIQNLNDKLLKEGE
jgi:hypothetical protein